MMQKQFDYINNGLSDDGFRTLPWAIITLFLILLGSILYATNSFAVLGVNTELAELGADVFLKYLFIVVAVERAAAVLVGMARNTGQVDWSLRINRISEILQKDEPVHAVLKQVYTREHRLIIKLQQTKTIGEISDVPEQATNEHYLGYLTSAKHAYEFQRARFTSVSNRYVARIVFFAGIILAILGLSVFSDLFQQTNLVMEMADKIESGAMNAQGLAWQTGLLRFTDIIVTGGLLGGGSAGLNAAANKMSEFINKT